MTPALAAGTGSRARRRLLTVALSSALAGFFVFPLWPRTKFPALHGQDDCPGEGACAHGHQGWEQRATRDQGLIRQWWEHLPYNVGIATGPSGLYVVDLDAAHGHRPPAEWAGATHGRDVLARLADRHGQPFPTTFTVTTPSHGLHQYYWAPRTPRLRSTIARHWRIDSRGHGGFIVAPGSRLAHGVYTVAAPRHVIMPLPAWMVAEFAARPVPPPAPARTAALRAVGLDRRRRAYLGTVLAGVRHAAPKGAHKALLAAACTLGRLVAGGDYDAEEVTSALSAAAFARHIPAQEAEQAIRDGLAFGAQFERTLDER